MNPNPMSCVHFSWKVGPYVDGELAAAERDELAEHLEECPECREMAVAFRALDRVAGQDAPPAVSGREWAEVLANVTRGERPVERSPTAHPWSWLVPLSGLAALVLVAVVLGRELFWTAGDVPAPSGDTADQAVERLDQDAGIRIDTPEDEVPPERREPRASDIDGANPRDRLPPDERY